MGSYDGFSMLEAKAARNTSPRSKVTAITFCFTGHDINPAPRSTEVPLSLRYHQGKYADATGQPRMLK